MANLYGTITNDKGGRSTRTGSRYITTTAETWAAIVEVELWKDGRCTVTATDKNGGNRRQLWEGNADEAVKGEPPN